MTYYCCIAQERLERANDAVDIFALIHKTQASRIGQFPYDIKGIILQPSAKIADAGVPRSIGIPQFELVEDFCRGGVNKGFKLDQGAHRVGIGNGPAEFGMELFVE